MIAQLSHDSLPVCLAKSKRVEPKLESAWECRLREHTYALIERLQLRPVRYADDGRWRKIVRDRGQKTFLIRCIEGGGRLVHPSRDQRSEALFPTRHEKVVLTDLFKRLPFCQDAAAGCHTTRTPRCKSSAFWANLGRGFFAMTQDERRLFELLRSTARLMLLLAEGFKFELMVGLVRAGFVTAKAAHVFAAGRPVVVSRVWITDVGRRALKPEAQPARGFRLAQRR